MVGLRGPEAEAGFQYAVHDGVQPALDEPLPVLLAAPHVDVAQAGLGAVRDVDDQALGRLTAQALSEYAKR